MGAGTPFKKRNAEFQNTGGIPRLLAELHGSSVNSTLFRDFQLLSPISTRHQAEFANSNLDREFRPKMRIPRRLAPRVLGDVGRGGFQLQVIFPFSRRKFGVCSRSELNFQAAKQGEARA